MYRHVPWTMSGHVPKSWWDRTQLEFSTRDADEVILQQDVLVYRISRLYNKYRQSSQQMFNLHRASSTFSQKGRNCRCSLKILRPDLICERLSKEKSQHFHCRMLALPYHSGRHKTKTNRKQKTLFWWTPFKAFSAPSSAPARIQDTMQSTITINDWGWYGIVSG